jgi:hypothetical protein
VSNDRPEVNLSLRPVGIIQRSEAMKIGLGLMMMGDLPSESVTSLVGVTSSIARMGEVVLLNPKRVSPHDRARFEVMTKAIEHGCELLFWLDDDMVVPGFAVERLRLALDETKAQMVCGRYSRRGYPYTSVWSLWDEEKQRYDQCDAKEGRYEISSSGLGCALVDVRWVEEHVERPWFRMTQGKEFVIATEDVSFCEGIRRGGGKIVGEAGVRCGHLTGRGVVDDESETRLRAEEVEHG